MRHPSPDIIQKVLYRQTQPIQEHSIAPAAGLSPGSQGVSIPNYLHNSKQSQTDASWNSQDFDIFARPEEVRTNSWAVCWSDLMMTMFIMFAALYVFQAHHTTIPQPIADVDFAPAAVHSLTPAPDDSPLVRFYDQVTAVIQQAGLESMVAARLVPGKSVHLIVDGDQFFDPGKSVLKAKGRAVVQALSDVLRQSAYYINVGGYTASDDAPGLSGWELATARAGAVVQALVRDAGLSQERMILLGHAQPAAQAVHGSKAWARRTELVVSLDDVSAALPDTKRNQQQNTGITRWLVSPDTQGE